MKTKQENLDLINNKLHEAFPDRNFNQKHPCGYAHYPGNNTCSSDKEKFGAICTECGGTDWVFTNKPLITDVIRYFGGDMRLQGDGELELINDNGLWQTMLPVDMGKPLLKDQSEEIITNVARLMNI